MVEEKEPDRGWWSAPFQTLLNYDGFASEHGDEARHFQGGFPGLDSNDDESEIILLKQSYDEIVRRLERLDELVQQVKFWSVFETIGEPEPPALGSFIAHCDASPYRSTYERPAEFLAASLLAFFADRLKIYLREKGAPHDLIDAVFALPGQDDLLMIVRRVEALGRLLDSEDGQNLLIGYRRAANILRAEEKKDGTAFAGKHARTALSPPAEIYLADAVASVGAAARESVAAEDFEGAMRALATLRAPVDAFFLDVTVNDPDPQTRLNRLRLLNELREAMHGVADFSKVAG